jgi:hypothetical protein
MNEFDLSVKFVEALAQTNQSFGNFSLELHSIPQVLSVNSGTEFRRYTEQLVIEIYIEAELDNDNCVCWWLEIAKKESEWEISSRILLNADSGQEILKEFPSLSAKTIAELESALKEQVNPNFLDAAFCKSL